MTLSIISINYNNAEGLLKTLKSVLNQTCTAFEHIIVDGASTDNAVEIIQQYEKDATARGIKVVWVSENDKGIYNAMNKGIKMASGEYIQILNSGDCLAADTVVESMFSALKEKECPEILYGNMIKAYPNGVVIGKSTETPYSFHNYFVSTLNHDCAYIKRSLFDDDQYGLYDETLKIVSDWKWYTQAIGLGRVEPVYVNIDVTIFDSEGISETNLKLRKEEREKVLKEITPPAVWVDYNKHSFHIDQMNRLERYSLFYKLVWFIERCLFKWERWTKK